MVVPVLLAAAGCVLAVGLFALWHRRRVTVAWRRRLAVVTAHARRLRRGASAGEHDHATATRACTSMLQFAEERTALGLLPSLGRRRHRERVALERAADDLLVRLAGLADAATATGGRPTASRERPDTG